MNNILGPEGVRLWISTDVSVVVTTERGGPSEMTTISATTPTFFKVESSSFFRIVQKLGDWGGMWECGHQVVEGAD